MTVTPRSRCIQRPQTTHNFSSWVSWKPATAARCAWLRCLRSHGRARLHVSARPLPLNNWSVHQLNERPVAAPITACQKPDEHGPPTAEPRPFQGESPHAEAREPLLPARMSRSPSPGRLDTRSRGNERRVSSHGDGRGEGDARRRGRARRIARRRWAGTSHRSGRPSALPCPGRQLLVLSTKFVVRAPGT